MKNEFEKCLRNLYNLAKRGTNATGTTWRYFKHFVQKFMQVCVEKEINIDRNEDGEAKRERRPRRR
jgi:hypothetical protein